MKKILIIISLLILLAGCGSDTKNLKCTHLDTDKSKVTTKTVVNISFSKDGAKALKLKEIIYKTLDKKTYSKSQAQDYLNSLKSANLCKKTKEIIKNEEAMSCRANYKTYEAIITYEYDLDKLSSDEQYLVLNGNQIYKDYKNYLKENKYSCK